MFQQLTWAIKELFYFRTLGISSIQICVLYLTNELLYLKCETFIIICGGLVWETPKRDEQSQQCRVREPLGRNTPMPSKIVCVREVRYDSLRSLNATEFSDQRSYQKNEP